MNPTDAFRKEERKKQVNRNKLERKFQREAHRLNNTTALKDELKSIIMAEEDGTLNKNLRLKKKVLQEAYDQAVRKQKVIIVLFKMTEVYRRQRCGLRRKRLRQKRRQLQVEWGMEMHCHPWHSH